MSIELIVSGGALGSDSVWSYIAEQNGVPKDKIIHIIATGLTRPVGNEARKEEQQSGTNKVLTLKELNTAIEEMVKLQIRISGVTADSYFSNYFKYGYAALSYAQKLHARNYYQTALTDNIYAVTKLVNNEPTGGTATAINLGIAMGKKIYVLNTEDCQWYTYINGKFELTDNVHLEGKCACIGTRTLVKYKTKKYGMWVDAPYVGETKEQKLREAMAAAIR